MPSCIAYDDVQPSLRLEYGCNRFAASGTSHQELEDGTSIAVVSQITQISNHFRCAINPESHFKKGYTIGDAEQDRVCRELFNELLERSESTRGLSFSTSGRASIGTNSRQISNYRSSRLMRLRTRPCGLQTESCRLSCIPQKK